MLWNVQGVMMLIDAEAESAKKRGPCKPQADKAA